ncbi:hypothetical protein [Micrococcus sp. TA1]|uniref:hypothetical protein n=1 Tax=Micrococcus sp. TA1 TaxID=681627 RepID=UPI0016166932|nr:hypothetical protein [Micrococcus sp. TA1]MBB5747976.1 hypothetical protein [Micrococcus sp. TA1]
MITNVVVRRIDRGHCVMSVYVANKLTRNAEYISAVAEVSIDSGTPQSLPFPPATIVPQDQAGGPKELKNGLPSAEGRLVEYDVSLKQGETVLDSKSGSGTCQEQ